jgi:hypothetical protein
MTAPIWAAVFSFSPEPSAATLSPALAYGKQRTGREMGSEALQADAVETWVAPTSRSRCSQE